MIHTLVARLIEREGGYSNHPYDSGGPTNMGITQGTLAEWRDTEVSEEDVQNLTYDEASEIYYQRYWKDPGFYKLKNRSFVVEDMLFDAAVHHGPSSAIKMLQRAVNEVDDGIIGPTTLRTVEMFPNSNLAASFMGERVTELGRIITRKNKNASFAYGWMRRMKDFIRAIPHA